MATAELFNESAGDSTSEGADQTVQATSTPDPASTAPAGTDPAPEATVEYEEDWLKDFAGGKYRTKADAIKGYDEFGKLVQSKSAAAKEFEAKAAALEERWKTAEQILGAPVDEQGNPKPYELKLPEGGNFDESLKGAFEDFCRKNNLSNAVAQQALEEIVIPWEVGGEVGRREAEKKMVVDSLGGGDEAVAGKIVGDLFEWASGYLGGDKEKIARLENGIGKYGEAILALADLREALTGVSVGRGTGGTAGLDQAGYEAIIASPGWQNDEAKMQQVVRYLNAKHPD